MMERPIHILAFSAQTEEALNKNMENHQTYFLDAPHSFKDIAYTTNIGNGRSLFEYRAVVIADDNTSAFRAIQRKGQIQGKVEQQEKPKLCMLFPGQGSQYPEMANQLYSTSPLFKHHFDECCNILDEECNNELNLKKILWSSTGSPDELNTSINSQIAIFCVNFCLFKLWTSWGIKPDYVLGHSLGESAATTAVGAQDLRSGLKSLLLRTKRIDKLGTGKMIAVKADKKAVEKIIKEFLVDKPEKWLDTAAVNSSEQIVLSGDCETVEQFYQFCKASGVVSVIIASSHAFHSRMLDPAMKDIKKGLIAIKSQSPEKIRMTAGIKYISSSEARIVEHKELLDESYWVANTRNTVRFAEACQVALQEGCRLFIEVGAQPILSTLVKVNCLGIGKNIGQVTCLPSLRKNGNDWETMLSSLAEYWLTPRGSEVDWKAFDKPYESQRRKVSLVPFNTFISEQEKVDTLLKSEHPLIGRCTEITNDSITFRREVDLNVCNFTGQLGGTFLAICVAVGTTINQQQSSKMRDERPVVINDFKMTRPHQFVRDDDGATSLQVIFVKVSSSEKTLSPHNIQIFLEIQDSVSKMNQWVELCSTTFERISIIEQNVGYFYFNVKFRTETWTKMTSDEIIKIQSTQFEASFLQGWKDPQEAGCILVSLEIPSSELAKVSHDDSYFIHPIITKAMIQLTLSILSKGCVPVANFTLKRFSVFEKLRMTHEENGKWKIYMFTKLDESAGTFDVWLIQPMGRVLVVMEGLQMQNHTHS